MVVATVIIGGHYLKLDFIGTMAHTLSDDVRACALEMSQRPIKGDVVWVAPHGAGGHCIKTAQVAISDGAFLGRCAGFSGAAKVIGGVTVTSLGAAICPEGLASLEHVNDGCIKKFNY